jgi:hypothetical protein
MTESEGKLRVLLVTSFPMLIATLLRFIRLRGRPWFEAPRTRLRSLDRPKIVAPHHEAGRSQVSVKLV